MNLANFTLHDQSEHMESWARYGFELDPRPRAPLIDFSDASWTEERILHEVRTSLQRIQADGFQAIMIGGLSNAMAYAWIIAHDMDLRVIMARTPRERTPDGKFIFRLSGWQELLPPAAVSLGVIKSQIQKEQTMQTIPPAVTPEYFQALERLLAETEKFLRKQSGIGQLRQAMREAEALTPPCEYCHENPAFSVVWTDDHDEYATFLCPECDERESKALDED